jgi:hypothetical protein
VAPIPIKATSRECPEISLGRQPSLPRERIDNSRAEAALKETALTNAKANMPERQSKDQSKGNLGQKEAQIKKEKDSNLSHIGQKSSAMT